MQKRFTTDHPNAKKMIFQSLNKKWKDYRARLKAKYYVPGNRLASVQGMKDSRVQKDQWLSLVEYWLTEEAEVL